MYSSSTTTVDGNTQAGMRNSSHVTHKYYMFATRSYLAVGHVKRAGTRVTLNKVQTVGVPLKVEARSVQPVDGRRNGHHGSGHAAQPI